VIVGGTNRIVALNNNDSSNDLFFADNYTAGIFSLRLNEADEDLATGGYAGRCNIWRPVFDARIQIRGSDPPGTPPDEGTGSGYLYLDSGGDYDGNLMFRFDGGNRAVVAIETPEEYTATAHTADTRDLDSNSSSVAKLADVLGTLINDLQNQGIVGTAE